MPKYDFTEQGYIEVYCGNVLVSRHRQEREAVESVLRHSELNKVSAEYTITKPMVKIKYDATPEVEVGVISSNSFFDLEGWSA